MAFNYLMKFLEQPYPFYYRGRNLGIVIAILFGMAFIFNYFFRPFNVYAPEHKMDYFWISLIHSLTPIIILLGWLFVIKSKSNVEEKWNIGNEMLFIGIFLFLIGVGQFLLRDVIYDNPDNWSIRYFIEEIRNTFMVGMLFVLILVPMNYNWLNALNVKRANLFEPEKISKHSNVADLKIQIKTQIKSDNFLMDIGQFLYAHSERNYVEIYINNENEIQKLVKRITITSLESQLNQYPFIIKSHRSYIINLRQIEKIMGNAQGYRISLKGVVATVPVSRTMISKFEKKLQLI